MIVDSFNSIHTLVAKFDAYFEAHDGCMIYVLSGEKNYAEFNNFKYTISDCICDNAFFTCLQQINGWFVSGYEYGFKWMVSECMQKASNKDVYQLVSNPPLFGN